MGCCYIFVIMELADQIILWGYWIFVALVYILRLKEKYPGVTALVVLFSFYIYMEGPVTNGTPMGKIFVDVVVCFTIIEKLSDLFLSRKKGKKIE